MARMFEWFVETGYGADITALHAEFDDVPWQTYAEWLVCPALIHGRSNMLDIENVSQMKTPRTFF